MIIDDELDDIYTIKDGLAVDDKIILEGIRQVREGEQIEFETVDAEEVMNHLKYRAE